MNTYQIVTERIVKLLEQGVIPWRRPWSAGGARQAEGRREPSRHRRIDARGGRTTVRPPPFTHDQVIRPAAFEGLRSFSALTFAIAQVKQEWRHAGRSIAPRADRPSGAKGAEGQAPAGARSGR